MVKFAHIADVHIGAWRDGKMADLPSDAFAESVVVAIAEGVDFICIAGDLFNTALPGIHHLKSTVRTLQKAKEAHIPVYCIPGSHDFSPSGKSMLDVLEEANLLVNVFKGEVVNGKLQLEPTVDKKTDTLLMGILGKKGMLDKQLYEDVDKEHIVKLREQHKHSVFLFHTSIEQLKTPELQKMEGYDISLLPEGFGYYAGGHVHIRNSTSRTGAEIVFPGPIFPASFSELEKLSHGSMCIVENNKHTSIPIHTKNTKCFHIKVEKQTPEQVTKKIIEEIEQADTADAIVLIRVSGSLVAGESSSIDFKRIFSLCYAKDAFFVMRNSVALSSQKVEVSQEASMSAQDIEKKMFFQRAGSSCSPTPSKEEEVALAQKLLLTVAQGKVEGETKGSYEDRMVEEAKSILGVE